MRSPRASVSIAPAGFALLITLLFAPAVQAQIEQQLLQLEQAVRAQGGQLPAPPRDAPPAAPGTGVIRGRVVAADTGQPLRRVQVRLNSQGSLGPGQTPANRLAMTDDRGRYEFRELRVGRYNVNAQKNGYIPLSWGQLRANAGGKPIDLADGQVLEKIDLSLPRGAAITGRIVDEFGEPAADVQVAAVRSQYVNGTRRLLPAGRSASTNDLGEFRLFALPPGDYFLSATLRINVGVETDDRTGYAPTYYPGSSDVAGAQKLTLAAGQTIQDLTLALLALRTARVSGTAIDSQGRPMRGNVQALQRTTTQGVQGGFGVAGQLRPDGAFTINGLAPGDYTIFSITQNGNPGGQPGGSPPDPEYAAADVTVSGQDVIGVRLVGARAATITGRIVRPAAGAGAPRPTALRVGARSIAGPGEIPVPGPVPPPAAVGDDWTFQARAKPGATRLFVQGLQPPWRVKEVRYRGVDITDSDIDIKAGDDLADFQVELTNRVTDLTATVTNTRGEPIADYWLIVFPRDREKRRAPSRYVLVARPPQDGRFRSSGPPPGDYLALAVESVDPGEATDPELLEKLEPRAVSFSLREGEAKVLDLKLGSLP